jgi:hypothetical protein
MSIELTAYELELLKIALVYAQKLEDAGETLTRDGLRRELSCGKDIASRLRQFIKDSKAVKLAEHLKALPERAEDRNVVEYALGDTESDYGFMLRENLRLKRALANTKQKTKAEKEQRSQEIRAEIEELKGLDRTVKPSVKVPITTGNLLEINIADAHLGKLAWSAETGHESYDTKIADAMYRRAQSALFARAGVKFEKVLMVIGNDLMHSDNTESTTTKGTVVSTDGRYHKTFYRARTLMIDSIEQARKIAPVHVVVMPGNHDRLACFHLGDSLEMYFHGQSDVVIDNEPTSRKYFQWGKVMLMFCHGDREKRMDMPLTMASERPEMWGDTMFRECHTGHLHQVRTEELHGVRVRILPSLSPPDAWHANNAYVGNLRSAEGYIWNAKEGLIGQVFYTDDGQKPITTKREIV